MLTGSELALTQISDALPVLQKIDSLYYDLVALDQQVMMKQTQNMRKKASQGGAVGVIAAIVTCIVLNKVYDMLAKIGLINNLAAFVAPFVVVGLCVFTYRIVKRKIQNKEMPLSEIDIISVAMQDISNQIYTIAQNHQDVINTLPRDYRNYAAASYFERVLANGQADNIKEAISLYEEYLHRQRLESLNKQQLEHAKRQTEMLQEIEYNSREAARNADFAAMFSAMNYLR